MAFLLFLFIVYLCVIYGLKNGEKVSFLKGLRLSKWLFLSLRKAQAILYHFQTAIARGWGGGGDPFVNVTVNTKEENS